MQANENISQNGWQQENPSFGTPLGGNPTFYLSRKVEMI